MSQFAHRNVEDGFEHPLHNERFVLLACGAIVRQHRIDIGANFAWSPVIIDDRYAMILAHKKDRWFCLI